VDVELGRYLNKVKNIFQVVILCRCGTWYVPEYDERTYERLLLYVSVELSRYLNVKKGH